MRILVADDDATSRLILKGIAAKLGHTSEAVPDGEQALERLLTDTFDVLLTDWMMPGMDGPELCRHIRTDLADRYIYIVMTTSRTDPDQVVEGMQAGADDYLTKPVEPFAVRTRMIAAERVTALQHRLRHLNTELADANSRLLTLSVTDALTGLPNRRQMDLDLARAHERAGRTGRPYAVALLDIDHFKQYNDHYGHPAGDVVLRQVTDTIVGSARSAERLYRYGGEEFLLLLDTADGNDIRTAADRIRLAIADKAIPHAARTTPPPAITLSGGVAWWEPGDLNALCVVARADQGLYQAKAAGRNRIHIETSPGVPAL